MSSCAASETSLFIRIYKTLHYVGNNPIKYIESFAHLGHFITNQLTDNADILKRRKDFNEQANNVLCYFSKLSSSVKFRLFHPYCMNWNGSELWLLNNDQITDYAENGACRIIPSVICFRY